MGYSVYIHTNKVNGKRYVGVTRVKPERRWAKGEGYRDNSHFYAAIKKYGWDNFEHNVIKVDTEEKMFELEKYYIQLYDTTDQNKGYNQSIGGEAGCLKGVNSGSKEYYKERYNKNSTIYKERVMRRYYEHREEIIAKRKKRYLERKDEINAIRRLKKKKDDPIFSLW